MWQMACNALDTDTSNKDLPLSHFYTFDILDQTSASIERTIPRSTTKPDPPILPHVKRSIRLKVKDHAPTSISIPTSTSTPPHRLASYPPSPHRQDVRRSPFTHNSNGQRHQSDQRTCQYPSTRHRLYATRVGEWGSGAYE